MTSSAQSEVEPLTLKLITYNAQAGIHTPHYFYYLSRMWCHIMPNRQALWNLKRAAHFLATCDIVSLQEIDHGSRRTAGVNQVELLSRLTGIRYQAIQTNRRLGSLFRHGLGLLSRFRLEEVQYHALPGPLPGRGAMLARIGTPPHALWIATVHLSLTRKARHAQVNYIRDILEPCGHVILMGDFNTSPKDEEILLPLQTLGLHSVGEYLTFPSWNPRQPYDHIWLSAGIKTAFAAPVATIISDHLPMMAEISLPMDLSASLRGNLSL